MLSCAVTVASLVRECPDVPGEKIARFAHVLSRLD